MSTSIFEKLGNFLKSIFLRRRPQISIIIPFSSGDRDRMRNFRWLFKYWKDNLPQAEIIIGRSSGKIFCKGEAMNRAVRRSRGAILAILDADAFLPASTIERCANRILEADKRGHNIWFIPYRWLSRLDKHTTRQVVHSNPKHPHKLPCPPPKAWTDVQSHGKYYGYRFCAMAFVFPRRAWEAIGGFDERFVGWGGEDICFMKTLDTIWGKHKTIKGCIYHLFHPYKGHYTSRKWEGQERTNDELTSKYFRANRNPSLMWELILESKISDEL